jgi:hypothetical protein
VLASTPYCLFSFVELYLQNYTYTQLNSQVCDCIYFPNIIGKKQSY